MKSWPEAAAGELTVKPSSTFSARSSKAGARLDDARHAVLARRRRACRPRAAARSCRCRRAAARARSAACRSRGPCSRAGPCPSPRRAACRRSRASARRGRGRRTSSTLLVTSPLPNARSTSIGFTRVGATTRSPTATGEATMRWKGLLSGLRPSARHSSRPVAGIVAGHDVAARDDDLDLACRAAPRSASCRRRATRSAPSWAARRGSGSCRSRRRGRPGRRGRRSSCRGAPGRRATPSSSSGELP